MTKYFSKRDLDRAINELEVLALEIADKTRNKNVEIGKKAHELLHELYNSYQTATGKYISIIDRIYYRTYNKMPK